MAAASPRVAVVDYGAGNLRSVAKALERSALRVDVCADPAALALSDAIVLPGVGAFADAAANLRAKGMHDAVLGWITSGRPYLGLCLGLQLLFDEADEHGRTPGLGVFRGRVERFADVGASGRARRVPHIGWNEVRFRGAHPLLASLPAADTFYFVHSYCAVPQEPEVVAGTADYDGPFTAAVARDNVFAVQFHPEKSQSAGRRLLDAFAAWVRAC
jgi:glutamine amidotransferase